MKHKKEKKKRKRRSPSTSSSSSSGDNEWVEKSPLHVSKAPVKPPASNIQEIPPQASSLGCSFLDLALSSSSSREKKEKIAPANKMQPIELPVGIYYPNRKQETCTKNDLTDKSHKLFSRDEHSSGRSNKQFQKPNSKGESDNKYSSERQKHDKYEKLDRRSSKKYQKPSSSDDSDTETNYKNKRCEKYDRSVGQSKQKFQKPVSSDEEHDRKKYGRNSERSQNRHFQKPSSSDEDSNYNIHNKKDRYGKFNNSERESSNQYQRSHHENVKYEHNGRRQFQKPASDDENDSLRKDRHDKHNKDVWRDNLVISSRTNDRGSSRSHDKLEVGYSKRDDSSSKSQNVRVTHDDVNKIAAKLIRAEIMGNTEEVDKLKAELAVARAQKVDVSPRLEPAKKEEKKVVVVSEQGNMKDRRRADLLERKKLAFLGDNDDRFVAEGKSFPNIGDEYEEQEDNRRKRKKVKTDSSQANAIQDHKRSTQILNSCVYCLSSASKNHPLLIEHVSGQVYLALPDREPLVPNHCMIVTSDHISSLRSTESDTYQCIKSLCEKLVSMFSKQDKTCVFFEMVNNLKWNHCHIHCVPLSREVGDLAPIYFQKAISDLEADTRHNKTLTKIERNKLCTSIPNEMEYFYVNFDWDKGFAHVIENRMSNTFAEEIIGGMLDLSPSQWRNPAPLDYQARMKLKLNFLNLYRS